MGLRNRVMLETMYRAGLRVDELVNLRPENIKFSESRIDVRHAKGGKARSVPIPESLLAWLRLWFDKRPAHSEWFFCTIMAGKEGNRLYTSQLRHLMAHLGSKAGFVPGECHPHKLRHTYATELLEEGFTLPQVQILLGHANLATTSRYLHVRDVDLAAKMAARDTEGRADRARVALEEAMGADAIAALKKLLGR